MEMDLVMQSELASDAFWTQAARQRLDRRVERVRLAKLAKTKGYVIDWREVKDEDLPRLWKEVLAFQAATGEVTRPSLVALMGTELDQILEPVDAWRRPKFSLGDAARAASRSTPEPVPVPGPESGQGPGPEPESRPRPVVVPRGRGFGVSRVSGGRFEARPYLLRAQRSVRVYCGRYRTFEEAVQAARHARAGHEVGPDFPGRLGPIGLKSLSPAYRISDDEVRSMRRAYRDGVPIRTIAAVFDRQIWQVRNVVRRLSYAGIPDADAECDDESHGDRVVDRTHNGSEVAGAGVLPDHPG